MIDFKFTANCTFQAENLDEAFNKLAEHFKKLANGENINSHESSFDGRMTIRKWVENDKS